MKIPVVLVATALTIAILLAASLLIAKETRGDNGGAVIGDGRPSHRDNEPVATFAEADLIHHRYHLIEEFIPGIRKAALVRSTAS